MEGRREEAVKQRQGLSSAERGNITDAFLPAVLSHWVIEGLAHLGLSCRWIRPYTVHDDKAHKHSVAVVPYKDAKTEIS